MSSRPQLVAGAVHAVAIVTIWLLAIVIYALAFTRGPALGWVAIDGVLIAAGGWVLHTHRDALGFAVLGPRKLGKLLAIVAFSIGCVALVQLLIADRGGIWLDETNYLATLREGQIQRDGVFPFNLRWLEPMLAGPLNIFPASDAAALKAVNFGAFVVAAVYLVLLLLRLGVKLTIAFSAPVFLLCSYLGVYGASNRLVLDPFNYALFVIVFHTLIRREHAAYFAAALLVTACNSEKAVYWIPVFALVELVRGGGLIPAAKHTLKYCGPALLYLVAIRLYLWGSPSESQLFLENLHVLGFSWHEPQIVDETVKLNRFQHLWFPFGGFTVYALLGFTTCARWLKPIMLLLVPVLLSTLIATDTQRMVAYAFIVYLPFGLLYLARAFGELPLRWSRVLFGLTIALAVAEFYLFPMVRRFRSYELGAAVFEHRDAIQLALAALEVTLVGTIVFLHHTFGRAISRASAPR
ncbi:MAG: hypothetical protein WKG01_10140 [Kofleriaceae bacterium]